MTALIKKYAKFVTFSHSVFALPYALVAFVLAQRKGILISSEQSLLLTLLTMVFAVIAARTAAMSFNRIVDRKIDQKNPRTKDRGLVTGEVDGRSANLLLLFSSLLFLLFSYLLGTHCFILAPGVLLFLFFYSYCKRFTSFSHLVLGFALALAPGGAWWVLRPQLEAEPLILMFSVLFWVSGFDILYSCQDVEFDKSEKLCSIPRRIGVKNSLRIAFLFHVICFLSFMLLGLVSNLSRIYFYGMMLISMLLLGQHAVISEKDLTRVNLAFFTFNGIVSVCYLLLVLVSI